MFKGNIGTILLPFFFLLLLIVMWADDLDGRAGGNSHHRFGSVGKYTHWVKTKAFSIPAMSPRGLQLGNQRYRGSGEKSKGWAEPTRSTSKRSMAPCPETAAVTTGITL